ncbi:MAG: hypothetical protein LYZ70_07000 [Nitrososphaerales archaeon]|nr:hypothetical protein [Nitrososphaerales archaeon]
MVKLRRGYWTRKRIAVVVIAGWLSWLGIGLWVPPWLYGELLYTTTFNLNGQRYTLHIADAPPVSYRANITLSTVGFFTNLNDVHLKATIYDANLTDLRSHYEAFTFLHADYEVASDYSKTGYVKVPLLNQTGAGVWVAEGIITFIDQPNATGPFMVPINFTAGAKFICMSCLYSPSLVKQVEAYHFPLTFGPSTENFAIIQDQYNLKYGVALASFSFLLLQPIFESILIEEKKRKKSKKG